MRGGEPSNKTSSPTPSYKNGSTRSESLRETTAKVANGDAHTGAQSNGSFRNGVSPAATVRLPTTFFGHDREEVTRILIQGLGDLGYHRAAKALCAESGYQLEGPTVAAFRSAVLEGEWAAAEELLFGSKNPGDTGGRVALAHTRKIKGKTPRSRYFGSQSTGGLPLAEGADKEEMLFKLREQKYLELLESQDTGAAWKVLRQELTPLDQHAVKRLSQLSNFMMCKSPEDLRAVARWDGAQGGSRSKLLSELTESISPSIMIPEHRLAHLLDDLKEYWLDDCMYHNTSASPTLYTRHMCHRRDIPTMPILELRDHKDEVWHLQYSHDGTMLASGSKDHTVVIYSTANYKPLYHLTEHEGGITFVAWSYDNTKLISCSKEDDNSAKLWDMTNGRCIRTFDFTYPCTAAAFTPDNKYVVIGSQEKPKPIVVCDLETNEEHLWEEQMRVNDLAITRDGKHLIVVTARRVHVYDFATTDKICEIDAMDEGDFAYVAVGDDLKSMLIGRYPGRIELRLVEQGEPCMCYDGHKQEGNVCRAEFGGDKGSFIVSGSEDGQIYLWRPNGRFVERFEAHPLGCVNAVSWNPNDPKEFASAGDDHCVRIWRPETPVDDAAATRPRPTGLL